MILTHKIALDLNNKQVTYCQQSAGTARFAYNWALANWNAQYKAWQADNSLQKPTQAALRRQLNAVKREQFPWMLKKSRKMRRKWRLFNLARRLKISLRDEQNTPFSRKKVKAATVLSLQTTNFRSMVQAYASRI